MKIKIVKASYSTYWYADKIGQILEVKDVVDLKEYKVKVSSCKGVTHFVDFNDAEVIEE